MPYQIPKRRERFLRRSQITSTTSFSHSTRPENDDCDNLPAFYGSGKNVISTNCLQLTVVVASNDDVITTATDDDAMGESAIHVQLAIRLLFYAAMKALTVTKKTCSNYN